MTDKKRRRTVARSKEAERRLARIVGGQRNPTTGKGEVDVETDEEAFQLKSLSSLPDWLHAAWEQTQADASVVGKAPILVLEEIRSGGNNVRYYIQGERAWLKRREEAKEAEEAMAMEMGYRRPKKGRQPTGESHRPRPKGS